MLKLTPDLIVHKGNVFYFLYVVGGFLMTVTAGGRCVDAALRSAQNPENLLRLSKAFIGFMGLGHQTRVGRETQAVVKQKLKKLHFNESFGSLLDMTRTSLQDAHNLNILCVFLCPPERQTESTPQNWISAQRGKIYYILLRGGKQPPIQMLCIGGRGSGLTTFASSHQLRWLIDFSRKTHARGDVVFLLFGGQARGIQPGSDINDARVDPTSLTLGFSALFVALLWMFLPQIAVCAVIFLAWNTQQRSRQK